MISHLNKTFVIGMFSVFFVSQAHAGAFQCKTNENSEGGYSKVELLRLEDGSFELRETRHPEGGPGGTPETDDTKVILTNLKYCQTAPSNALITRCRVANLTDYSNVETEKSVITTVEYDPYRKVSTEKTVTKLNIHVKGPSLQTLKDYSFDLSDCHEVSDPVKSNQ